MTDANGLDVERLAEAIANVAETADYNWGVSVSADDAAAIAREYERLAEANGGACQSDLRCYRNDGHEPPHMYDPVRYPDG